MWSASTARSRSPRCSRACRSSLSELLEGLCDFVGRLQRVVDGPVPCSVVNHSASIAHRLRGLRAYWRRHIAGAEERPMAVSFQLVIDCDDPEPLARFWAAALG